MRSMRFNSSFVTTNYLKCFLNCQQNNCLYLATNENNCKIYNQNANNYLVQVIGTELHKRFIFKLLVSMHHSNFPYVLISSKFLANSWIILPTFEWYFWFKMSMKSSWEIVGRRAQNWEMFYEKLTQWSN